MVVVLIWKALGVTGDDRVAADCISISLAWCDLGVQKVAVYNQSSNGRNCIEVAARRTAGTAV